MSSKRRLILQIRDLCVFGALGLPLIFVHFFAPTYQRGFFCDDDSIRYPFHNSTVSSAALILITMIIAPLLIVVSEAGIVVLERRISHPREGSQYVFHHSRSLYRFFIRSYTFVGFFTVGMLFCQWITVGGKKAIGRLRPHFLDVCQPKGINLTACQSSHRYFQDFECTPTHGDYYAMDSRNSFPSGHASASFYAALFLVLYWESRLRQPLWRPIALPAVQFVLLLLAFLCALSRVSDYKHHPTDVIAGSIIGIFSAVATAVYVAKLFSLKPEVRYKNLTQVRVLRSLLPSSLVLDCIYQLVADIRGTGGHRGMKWAQYLSGGGWKVYPALNLNKLAVFVLLTLVVVEFFIPHSAL